jgi:hypothetical protein
VCRALIWIKSRQTKSRDAKKLLIYLNDAQREICEQLRQEPAPMPFRRDTGNPHASAITAT